MNKGMVAENRKPHKRKQADEKQTGEFDRIRFAFLYEENQCDCYGNDKKNLQDRAVIGIPEPQENVPIADPFSALVGHAASDLGTVKSIVQHIFPGEKTGDKPL